MSALRKTSCISLQGNVMSSKEKVALFYFHLISQRKILHCRGGVCSEGVFPPGQINISW